MKIYHYKRTTREFCGESNARPDPKEKGRFLIPACATTIAPPTVKANEKAVFTDNAWNVVEDHRGTTVYSTAPRPEGEIRDTKTIDELGPIPDGWVDQAPNDDVMDEWNGTAWAPDPGKVKFYKEMELKYELRQNDISCLRALRAISLGVDTPADRDKLNTMEENAKPLRSELKKL